MAHLKLHSMTRRFQAGLLRLAGGTGDSLQCRVDPGKGAVNLGGVMFAKVHTAQGVAQYFCPCKARSAANDNARGDFHAILGLRRG